MAKKGIHRSKDTEFKKGITPWNKGKSSWNKGKRYKLKSYNNRENHPRWPGGKHIHSSGYVYIRINGTYVREHKYIMEQFIGRKLEPNEVVHHINGIKTDNRIENLQVLDIVEHGKLHRRKNVGG